MMKTQEIYRCSRCGLQIMVTSPGLESVKAPLCCGIPMTQQKANTVDAAKEKHVPVIEAKDGGTLVKVGSIPHPQSAEHLIEWIELIHPNGQCYRAELTPAMAPEAFFPVPFSAELKARISCNLHGIWMDR